jgi:hypothetical protein
MKLNVKAFGLASGITWAINWFGLTWFMIAVDGVTREITIIGRIYRGWTLSPIGSIVALIWGFLDGFFIGVLVAWFYNKIIPYIQSKNENK